MKIYFAGSIRGGREDKEIYLKIIECLKGYGQVLTEHIGSSELNQNGETAITDRFIYERDLNWLMDSDVVVAEVTNPSLGVGYEIGKAEESGKKILCLYRIQEGRKLSAMISGNENIKVLNYENIEEAYRLLDYFFKI